VNESQSDFTVVEGKIRFGLAAVKNVGEGAVEAVLEARKGSEEDSNGRFSDLGAFARRVDVGRVNRRVVESLIKCGAFDGIARDTGATRAGLMADVDRVLEAAQKEQRERASGQFNLFGAGGGAARPEKTEPVPEWPENQLLAYEKESLGFYITGHPLAQHADLLRRFTDARTIDVPDLPDGREIKIGGVVLSMREVRTKKGKLMGFVSLEDLDGFVEVIVFPDIYAGISTLLKSESPILVTGTVEHGGETDKIIARDIFPLTEVRERLAVPFHFRLAAPGLSAEHFERLKVILKEHKGPCPVILHLILPNHSETIISLPDSLGVKPSAELEGILEKELGATLSMGESRDEPPTGILQERLAAEGPEEPPEYLENHPDGEPEPDPESAFPDV
jgi:DNA polymerase-3 subunit alpha